MPVIRVVLVDDHRIFREALQLELARVSDIEVTGMAANASEAIGMLETARPDVVVLDIGLPEVNGVELAGQLLAAAPSTKIVALSGYADRFFVQAMLQAGAGAYIVKSAGVEELLAGIRAVMAGETYYSVDAMRALMPTTDKGAPALTARELSVLRCIAGGMRAAEIAAKLGIAAGTVEAHRKHIKAKLGLRSIAELIRYALREGVVKS